MKYLSFLLAALVLVSSLGAAYAFSGYQAVSSRNGALAEENKYLRSQLNLSASEYHNLLENFSTTRYVYQTPGRNTSIDIWTRPANIGPNTWTYWALLDTFDNHIRMTTNSTVTLLVMDVNNYVKFAAGASYASVYNSTGTSFSHDEPIAEGCGAYILVVLNRSHAIVNLAPDITATYAPAPFLTGVCGT